MPVTTEERNLSRRRRGAPPLHPNSKCKGCGKQCPTKVEYCSQTCLQMCSGQGMTSK